MANVRHSLVQPSTLVFAALTIVLLIPASRQAGAQDPAQADACGPPFVPPEPPALAEGAVPVKVSLAQGTNTEVAFGINRNIPDGIINVPLTADGTLPPAREQLKVVVGDFKRVGGNGIIGGVKAKAVVRDDRRHIDLTVCIPPESVGTGTFKGPVTIDDARLDAEPIAYTVTAQYQSWLRVLLASLATCVGAAYYSYATATTRGRLFSPKAFWRWLRSNFVAVLAGLAAAAGVFFLHYVDDPAFGGSAWRGLVAAVFTAFTTALILPAGAKSRSNQRG